VQISVMNQLLKAKTKQYSANIRATEHQKIVIEALSTKMNGLTINLLLNGASKFRWIPVLCEKKSLVDAADKAKKLVTADTNGNDDLK
jgi:hypothetical protein